MTSKEKIFRAITSASGQSHSPDKVDFTTRPRDNHSNFQKSNEDIIHRYMNAVERSGGKAFRFISLDEMLSWVKEFIKKDQCSRIYVSLDETLCRLAESISKFAKENDVEIKLHKDELLTESQRVELRKYLEVTDISLTKGLAGFADTGAVAIYSQAGEARAATLLPTTHICILNKENIYHDMDTALPVLEKLMIEKNPSAITFICGPSRTADIEKVLVTGVHGPKNFILCII